MTDVSIFQVRKPLVCSYAVPGTKHRVRPDLFGGRFEIVDDVTGDEDHELTARLRTEFKGRPLSARLLYDVGRRVLALRGAQ